MSIPPGTSGNSSVNQPPVSQANSSSAAVNPLNARAISVAGSAFKAVSPGTKPFKPWVSPIKPPIATQEVPDAMKALIKDLDVWVATQDQKYDAGIVKAAIVQGAVTGEDFHLDISQLKISSLPLCLANLKLTELNCSWCLFLTQFPDLPNCTRLVCSGCPLKALPNLPSCTYLDCESCPFLVALPHLPSCTDLDCESCPLLAALPNLPSCTDLSCSYCPLLAALPHLPSCTYLTCSYCPLLTTLSNLPSCTNLDCSYCPLLTTLSNLPSCTDLDCSSCPRLAMLPDLPSCTDLDCSSCPRLAILPNLPSCTDLDCSSCPRLTALPALPGNARIGSEGCLLLNPEAQVVPPSDLGIRWKDLNEDPLKVLRALLPYLKRGIFPEIVFLNDDGNPQEGSDIGGLGRHLMSQLFTQLAKVGCIPKNPGTELLRPRVTAPPAETAAEKELLEALGLLFVQAANRNFPIGKIFVPDFFMDLQAFSGQNLSEYKKDPQTWIKEHCTQKNSDIATPIMACRTLEELVALKVTDTVIPEGLDLKGAKLFVLNACMEETVQARTPWYEAAYLIASAMKGRMGAAWETSCALAPEKFQASIEGSFSKEAFVAAIEWQGSNHAPTQAYLLKWISTHDEDMVKDLLQFSTGSRSLTGESVKVMISSPNIEGTFPLPTSHACARQLCLATGYSSQEMFDAKIKESLENAEDSGFLFG